MNLTWLPLWSACWYRVYSRLLPFKGTYLCTSCSTSLFIFLIEASLILSYFSLFCRTKSLYFSYFISCMAIWDYLKIYVDFLFKLLLITRSKLHWLIFAHLLFLLKLTTQLISLTLDKSYTCRVLLAIFIKAGDLAFFRNDLFYCLVNITFDLT